MTAKHWSSEEEDAVVGALLLIHRENEARARKRRGEPADPAAELRRRAQRLREERARTEEAVERLLAGARALPAQPVHQELELVGSPHGVAAGRVRIRNRSDSRARFELVYAELSEAGPRVKLDFEPQASELEPGEARLVRVRADLAEFRAGDCVSVPVECRWAFGRDRLWLSIRAEGTR
jgi:hypothetical protein